MRLMENLIVIPSNSERWWGSTECFLCNPRAFKDVEIPEAKLVKFHCAKQCGEYIMAGSVVKALSSEDYRQDNLAVLSRFTRRLFDNGKTIQIHNTEEADRDIEVQREFEESGGKSTGVE